ncbi:MAG: dihydrolipoyl dehydrogenase [Candidatus Sumerlaeia bacterium]
MSKAYDIAVIGSGPGGYVAALKAAEMGAKVALIEKDKPGGTCLNRGCIPTKAFLAGAELLHDIRHRAGILGIQVSGEATVDWSTLLKRKNQVLDGQRKGLHFLFGKREIDFIEGTAHFEGPGKIAVSGGKEDLTLEADKVIIATGSRPARIPGWPVSDKVVTSDEALDWTELPESLLIVGGGVIGCEFACLLAEFGVKVTIVEMLPQLITGMDGDLAKSLLKVFKKRKIDCLLETQVEKVEETDAGVKATLSNGDSIEASRMLVSVGRRPNTEELALDKLGIDVERGFIPVNDRMETTVVGHYAIGDVNGRILLAHAASAMAIVAVENALGADRESTAPVPWCVYTFPEIAGVGQTEDQARDRGIPIAMGTFPFTALGKAQAWGDPEGFVKVIRNRETDAIVGIHALGHGATEFIAAAGVLLHQKATAHDIEQMVFAHPTMSEAIKEATEVASFAPLHLPPLRRHRVSV